ncbi:MAG: endonuclease/exonuclease/phosphatase family protein [Aggregatilineales bacterium]
MDRQVFVRYTQTLFRHLEAGLVGLFFMQAIRFLYSTLYAHLGSLDQWTKTLDRTGLSGTLGVVVPGDVRIELILCGVAALLPLVALAIGRWRFATLAAVVIAVGRVYMTANGPSLIGVAGAAVAAGGAGLYLAIVTSHRPAVFPAALILGIAADQIIRLYGLSVDPTWSSAWLSIQVGLSLAMFALVLINLALDAAEKRRIERAARSERSDRANPDKPVLPTQITGWGALAMAGMLFLEFTLLGLSNTAARRAGVEPEAIAPWLLAATLVPLVPAVRDAARRFLGMFDGQWRGWVYGLLTGLMLVIGFRFNGPIAAGGFVVAQALIGLAWWWVVQPIDKGGWFSGPGVVIAIVLFLALTGADYFTYDYAFAYGLPEPFGTLLRSLRGFGLPIALVAALLTMLPAIVARRRLPWQGGRTLDTVLIFALGVLTLVFAISLTQPVVVRPNADPSKVRIATLNLHGGYSLYFNSVLPNVADQIDANGADVVLLQEVETGRLVSAGVDQVDWLAHKLNMQAVYFPTNEGLQGLALLTRLPVETRQGVLLSSIGKQTGILYARLTAPNHTVLEIYNTELGYLLKQSTQSTDSQEQDQLSQLGQIFGLISQLDPGLTTQVIVGGTFNNVPTSDLYLRMKQSFVDPFEGQAAEKTNTWQLVNNVTSRVDYLWLSKGITMSGAGIVPAPASTHNLVVVEIALTPPR